MADRIKGGRGESREIDLDDINKNMHQENSPEFGSSVEKKAPSSGEASKPTLSRQVLNKMNEMPEPFKPSPAVEAMINKAEMVFGLESDLWKMLSEDMAMVREQRGSNSYE